MESELAKYLYELGILKRIKRSGWWLLGVGEPESVAEHSFRVAAIAYFLAQEEGADLGKTLAMALFHDTGETRVNDLHRLGRRYVNWSGVEEKVVLDQTASLSEKAGMNLRALLDEARAKTSLEARIVKDADSLEYLLQAREYEAQGYAVEKWIKSSLEELSTSVARRLQKAILEAEPGSWRLSGG